MCDYLPKPHLAKECRMMKTQQDFIDAYTNCLEEVVRNHPEEYAWPISQAPVVALKMFQAILRQSYNKESRAIKVLCKRYQIPYTYKGIKDFVNTLEAK